MNPKTYTVGDPFIKFGADFYTEMYDVTRDVGGAVQQAYKNICNAIGWLIVAVGLLDVAYFGYKMASDEEKGNIAEVTKLPPDEDFFAKNKSKEFYREGEARSLLRRYC